MNSNWKEDSHIYPEMVTAINELQNTNHFANAIGNTMQSAIPMATSHVDCNKLRSDLDYWTNIVHGAEKGSIPKGGLSYKSIRISYHNAYTAYINSKCSSVYFLELGFPSDWDSRIVGKTPTDYVPISSGNAQARKG